MSRATSSAGHVVDASKGRTIGTSPRSGNVLDEGDECFVSIRRGVCVGRARRSGVVRRSTAAPSFEVEGDLKPLVGVDLIRMGPQVQENDLVGRRKCQDQPEVPRKRRDTNALPFDSPGEPIARRPIPSVAELLLQVDVRELHLARCPPICDRLVDSPARSDSKRSRCRVRGRRASARHHYDRSAARSSSEYSSSTSSPDSFATRS